MAKKQHGAFGINPRYTIEERFSKRSPTRFPAFWEFIAKILGAKE